jgi:outer membrane biosynthesis protein TonB
MRRKIRGVSEEELAANPLFTSRPQAPLQEQPPPPPPPVDPTAVPDRIVEHLIERLRAPQSVEPSPPDSPAPAPATPVSPPQESAAVQEPPQQTSPSPAPPKQKPSSNNPSPSTHLKLPPSRRAPRWLMTSRGSFRNGSTRQSAPGSTNAKSTSSSLQSPNLRFGLEPHLDREAARYGRVTNPAVLTQ